MLPYTQDGRSVVPLTHFMPPPQLTPTPPPSAMPKKSQIISLIYYLRNECKKQRKGSFQYSLKKFFFILSVFLN